MILSLNVWEGGLLWNNISQFLQKENADIMCLQEVFDSDLKQLNRFQTMKNLRNLFPAYHYSYAPQMHEICTDGEGDSGNAIFSRFPLTQPHTVFLRGTYEKIIRDESKGFTRYPSNAQFVRTTINDKTLHIGNVHGVWNTHGKDTPERLRMSELIINEITGKKPLILAGDFNLNPDTESVHLIEKQLVNVCKENIISTFNMKYKNDPGFATAIVDMFFASPNISIISKRIPDDDVSDHKPLIVEVEI
jgi:endonuclease/exonuclease/phosphatase family metal-dependent hydrolase